MTYIVKRIVLCSLIPGLIVTGTIVTNYSISRGKFIGYGRITCFLGTPLLVVITLVIPLCLILLANFIFFSITIVKIYNVRKLHTTTFRKDDQNNLFVYIKLSSLTGIFWILSVISEATDNNPLRFIAIALNGLQGVFIFGSYICNTRVLNLYLKLLGLEKYVSITSSFNKGTKVVTSIGKQSHKSEESATFE